MGRELGFHVRYTAIILERIIQQEHLVSSLHTHTHQASLRRELWSIPYAKTHCPMMEQWLNRFERIVGGH